MPKRLISLIVALLANRSGPGRTAPTASMEMLANSIAADCVIELEVAGGSRMRIRMKMSTPEVMNRVRYWWVRVHFP